MKKILLGFLMCLVLAVNCFAAEDIPQIVYSVYLRNDTADFADYLIPTTTIRPKVDKLWGYDCRTLAIAGKHTETWLSIFDGTDAIMTGECFSEREANGNESINDNWPRGKKIVNGIHVRIGAKSEAQIYYIRK